MDERNGEKAGDCVGYKGKYIDVNDVKKDKVEALMLLDLLKKMDGEDGLIRYIYSIINSVQRSIHN